MTTTDATPLAATTTATAAPTMTSVAENTTTAISSDVPENENENKATNFCWGKINAPELYYEDDVDIVDQINEDNDFEVELIKRLKKQKGDKVESPQYIEIKFKQSSIPEKVKCLQWDYRVNTPFQSFEKSPKPIKTILPRPRSGQPSLKIYNFFFFNFKI